MLPDDAPEVRNELERRLEVKAKAERKADDDGGNASSATKAKPKPKGKEKKVSSTNEGLDANTGTKWQQLHQQLAESRCLVVQLQIQLQHL